MRTNNLLFGLIGLLMVGIIGVGAMALRANPGAVSRIGNNMAASVQEAASSVTGVSDAATAAAPGTSEPRSSAGASAASGSYTMTQVAAHADASSCWTTIGGGVYDLTSWVNQHPGGRAAILSLCGKDGTSAFEAQHGGQARPEEELASLKIGALAQ
jgi:cytochrome b involved in lipid metabolism